MHVYVCVINSVLCVHYSFIVDVMRENGHTLGHILVVARVYMRITQIKHRILCHAFTPAAADFVWSKVKESFFDHGIEMFWLDDSEPNVNTKGLQYKCGPRFVTPFYFALLLQ